MVVKFDVMLLTRHFLVLSCIYFARVDVETCKLGTSRTSSTNLQWAVLNRAAFGWIRCCQGCISGSGVSSGVDLALEAAVFTALYSLLMSFSS